MPPPNFAARAYKASASHRGLRDQEADVFRYAIGALRSARDEDSVARVKALADNRRLWGMVTDLMLDPDNKLPEALRAQIISIGLAVQRNMDGDAPDFDFLIGVNENMAAGLSGAA